MTPAPPAVMAVKAPKYHLLAMVMPRMMRHRSSSLEAFDVARGSSGRVGRLSVWAFLLPGWSVFCSVLRDANICIHERGNEFRG